MKATTAANRSSSSKSKKSSKRMRSRASATKKRPTKKGMKRGSRKALRQATKKSARKSARKPASKPASRPAKKMAKRAASKAATKRARKGPATPRTAPRAASTQAARRPAKAASAKRRGRPAQKTEEEKRSPQAKKRIEQEMIDTIWKTYKKTGDENLRNILVEHHFPLVRYIAERLLQTLPKSIELDDLISAGTFGLLDAIRGFDLKRGIKFKTYCSTRIRGSILDELRSQDWVPRLVRLKAHKLDRAMRNLEAVHGREVNDYELAQQMEISMNELAELKAEASPKTIFSLSEKLDDSDDNKDMEKVEIIEDKRGTDPVQALQQQDVLEVITSNLTKKERLIIIMYYYEGLTMREIGDIMSLTESRVCQIHSNVMGRLKTQLKSLVVEGATL